MTTTATIFYNRTITNMIIFTTGNILVTNTNISICITGTTLLSAKYRHKYKYQTTSSFLP